MSDASVVFPIAAKTVVPAIPFADPDPFQEFTYPTVVAAKLAIADEIAMPLAKLPPEAMAEIMVCHETLAEEYAHILVGFMREDGFFLEYEPLQRGLMWALGRLAQVRATLLHSKNVVHYLLPYLASPDASVQGLAAWASGNLNALEAVPQIQKLIKNNQEVRFYMEGKLSTTTTGKLAQQALSVLTQQ